MFAGMRWSGETPLSFISYGNAWLATLNAFAVCGIDFGVYPEEDGRTVRSRQRGW